MSKNLFSRLTKNFGTWQKNFTLITSWKIFFWCPPNECYDPSTLTNKLVAPEVCQWSRTVFYTTDKFLTNFWQITDKLTKWYLTLFSNSWLMKGTVNFGSFSSKDMYSPYDTSITVGFSCVVVEKSPCQCECVRKVWKGFQSPGHVFAPLTHPWKAWPQSLFVDCTLVNRGKRFHLS